MRHLFHSLAANKTEWLVLFVKEMPRAALRRFKEKLLFIPFVVNAFYYPHARGGQWMGILYDALSHVALQVSDRLENCAVCVCLAKKQKS